MRVVVVDDEAIARRRMKRLLATMDDVEVVGEAGDGRAAVRAVDATRPDLVLLDVQMPELDGFDVARQLPAPGPLVMFVTAFDMYALRAFEIHAVDYLLKPVSRERLVDALAHARARAAAPPAGPDPRLASLLREVATRAWIDRLPIRSQGQVRLVDVTDIDWIESAGNYAVVHVGRQTHVLRETLTRLEAQLDPARFTRIHRSAIVQIDRIALLTSASRGDYDVALLDGTRLALSRTYRTRLERALGRPL